ncbi:MAG: N-carbamoylputrescine amidase [Candidatus Hydrogenedentota bacterium]|nr:MAG: N-carbamoylputrescine amidase [Candidatus Hydrogenedentota bacterium]
MSSVVVAATQMTCSWDRDENIKKAEGLVREAASKGARIILIQELFETPYFCQQEKVEFFDLATPLEENPAVNHFKPIAKELEVVLPIPFFEKENNNFFNTVAVIDADGEVMGKYRKTHIPDTPGYLEKYYFTPGDTGPRVWRTRYATIGIGICWDQYFPELARAMTLMGADIIFYPSAVGSVPTMPGFDQHPRWETAMRGHAAANVVHVVACNRVGTEVIDDSEITWMGSSFITDSEGDMLVEADRTSETVITAELDLEFTRQVRYAYGFFNHRRPDTYGSLLTYTGRTK